MLVTLRGKREEGVDIRLGNFERSYIHILNIRSISVWSMIHLERRFHLPLKNKINLSH